MRDHPRPRLRPAPRVGRPGRDPPRPRRASRLPRSNGMRRPLLELRDVHAGYSGIEVLHGIDLDAAAGELVVVLGPNGAGKTTMLRVAAGLLQPTSGQLLLGRRDVTGF